MWSPQRYLSIGRSKGISDDVLYEAIRQIQQVQKHRPALPAVLSLPHLATLSETHWKTLRTYVTRTSPDSYRHFRVRKRSGGYRRISVPTDELRTVQSWIAHNLLNLTRPHSASRAFSPHDSIVKCASDHCNAKWLIKLDIADFFGSVTEIQVYRVFRSLGYNALISLEMARLCTERVEKSQKYDLLSWQARETAYSIPGYSTGVLGRLPQGASTSPMLSNLVMTDIDAALEELGRRQQLRYTRYSDDITFSTTQSYSRQK